MRLVSAPAGYGKSTLVAEWASQVGRPVTWRSLDEADDDPLRFFTYFIAALQQVEANVGKDLAGTLRAGQLPPKEVIVAALANDLLAAPRAFVCVLDDFQAIQDHAIHDVLNGLAARPLRPFHLVLVTRETRPCRWRACAPGISSPKCAPAICASAATRSSAS